MVKVEPETRPQCLRCKATELREVASPKGISFFECPKCSRNYAQQPGAALCFRWQRPISLILYPVIFEANRAEHCEQVAA
jgi:transposase-like protein